ncbi:hypothetical protein ND861_07105 [Leptospira sp. 2 VSF19]|uniref:Uncharacterized protein n=1 Tax=Leptospira soteropolitanensis TaxID=2950025 RepID=A0AAW5VDD2_9LEPT|nr:hypothetical protein [Leptospira soteropolitanensis]MCW7494660.1 hypothetical protein [Leptospira soteropolitanensis]MCW7499998.1 hypothetical protein [Leptospira soteropolitanensis]MCW7522249.1 hypothetical protein [Leptospira soteropolitanensis]MCW7526105.1 hypothetical protein [Leptospira soteropolitanensis]MCW7529783.1 hypothetical protein [Leptospira soteropolitanensis]
MEIDWDEAIRLDNEMKATEYYRRVQEARQKRLAEEKTEDRPDREEN